MAEKFIELTSLTNKTNGGKIFVNVKHIGHFYRVAKKEDYGRVVEPEHTRLGVTTHNNGGFEVIETLEEILEKIHS